MKPQLSPRQAWGFSQGNAIIPPFNGYWLWVNGCWVFSFFFTFTFLEVPVSDDFHGCYHSVVLQNGYKWAYCQHALHSDLQRGSGEIPECPNARMPDKKKLNFKIYYIYIYNIFYIDLLIWIALNGHSGIRAFGHFCSQERIWQHVTEEPSLCDTFFSGH